MTRIVWSEAFFIARSTAVECPCVVCGRSMWLPPSKAGKYKNCSEECRIAAREKRNACKCETCGKEFYRTPTNRRPRRFCSQSCNTASGEAINQPQVIGPRLAAIRAKREAGDWTILRGEDHPNWKGGLAAHIVRIRADGRSREWQRRYQRNNPDKIREFASRRRRRSLPRLPVGTIAALRTAQRNKCAICRRSVALRNHLDHIIPLALGGGHESRNLQLLCPPCNQRKAAKHPLAHMRELGRLL